MILCKSNWIAAASMALACLASSVRGQDSSAPGIVRISDGGARAVQPTSFHGHGGSQGYVSQNGCPNGNCQNGQCSNGSNCPQCWGLFQEHYCCHSPDHGYSPPAKYPLHRRGVQYNSYFPNQWYGLPGGQLAGGYPMVYQPTDTTQMGFYYQHVPSWQPNPSPMPQRPIPANWHIVAPTVSAANFRNGWGGSCQNGNCWNGMNGSADYQMLESQPAPSQQSPTPIPTQSAPPAEISPVPQTAVPPAPGLFNNSASRDDGQRAFY
jgi:hypothetical protein